MENKKYSLRVLFPTSNQHKDRQSYSIEVYATNVATNNNTYQFWDDGNLVSCYPTQYTIIEEIEEL